MTTSDNPVLRSDIILFMSTKGKGQFFFAEQLSQELGVAARPPSLTLDELRAFLEGSARLNLLRRWKTNPIGGEGEVFPGA